MITTLALILTVAVHAATRPLDGPPAPLTASTCAPRLAKWTADLVRAADAGEIKHSPHELARLFDARTSLRAQLGRLTPAPRRCVDQVRRSLSTIRSIEDHLMLAANEPAVNGLQTADRSGVVKLRSGDVLVSRGNAFVSAAIAKIGAVEGDFSHVAQVYIDAPAGTEVDLRDAAADPRVHTIEAHIEVGSFTRPFRDYVADGNARVAQFRPRQPADDAHHAAWSIYDWVTRWQRAHAAAFGRAQPNVNDNPPYDFQMNLNDAKEVFCAEVVSIAQGTVGWRVPMYPTTLKQNELTRTMGITARTTFAPSDLEVDPRFAHLAEWRDLDKLGEVLKKDAVLSYVYAEMKANRIKLTPTPAEFAKAVFAWTVRKHDLGLMTKLPNNMNPNIIALTFVLDRIGRSLEDQLKTVP